MRLRLAAIALLAFAAPLASHAQKKMTVPLTTADGKDAGSATFRELRSGGLEVSLKLQNLPPGEHGVHVHENATCTPPDFKSAGAHFDPVAHQHENVTVDNEGKAHFHYQLSQLSIGTGEANDIRKHGVSIVIHEKSDDMKSDPTGNAGARIACGVLPSGGA